MAGQNQIPAPTHGLGAELIVVEAAGGPARRAALEHWLRDLGTGQDAVSRLLDCSREADGPWAGLKDLLATEVPQMEQQAPHLIARHDYELAVVLPELRQRISVRNPTLTDLAGTAERVRNWPADRAKRGLHGLINLLDEWWHGRTPGRQVIVCDSFDKAGALVQRFFAELMRRRGQRLNITLVVAVEPGAAERMRSLFDPDIPMTVANLNVPAGRPAELEPATLAAMAERLEKEIGRDQALAEIYMPRVIQLWRGAHRQDRLQPWLLRAVSTYCTQGLYEDAIPYGEEALSMLDQTVPDQSRSGFIVAAKLFNCYVGLGRATEAQAIMEQVRRTATDPDYLFRACYYLSMVYARFLPRPDFAIAEALLDQGLDHLSHTTLGETEKLFQTVFNRNGLALIRHRQGKPDEAIAMCSRGFEMLDRFLKPDEHRLHRSVLLYNIAQVYGATGKVMEAIQFYTDAMAMDPNYSEYYNERGGLLFRLGRLTEAEHDYRQAIELSPPYPEVWCNLGQCYRAMARYHEAAEAYTASLDLSPAQLVVFLGRAQVYEALGQSGAALLDYDSALQIDPAQPEVLGNRAVLHYEAGRLPEALVDLDRAVALAPDNADMYHNRSVVLQELGRSSEAAADLQQYELLQPGGMAS